MSGEIPLSYSDLIAAESLERLLLQLLCTMREVTQKIYYSSLHNWSHTSLPIQVHLSPQELSQFISISLMYRLWTLMEDPILTPYTLPVTFLAVRICAWWCKLSPVIPMPLHTEKPKSCEMWVEAKFRIWGLWSYPRGDPQLSLTSFGVQDAQHLPGWTHKTVVCITVLLLLSSPI